MCHSLHRVRYLSLLCKEYLAQLSYLVKLSNQYHSMSRSKYKIYDDNFPYFIQPTCNLGYLY